MEVSGLVLKHGYLFNPTLDPKMLASPYISLYIRITAKRNIKITKKC
jgi:hypothetical protein